MAILWSTNAEDGSLGLEKKQSAVKHILRKICKIQMKINFLLKNAVRKHE